MQDLLIANSMFIETAIATWIHKQVKSIIWCKVGLEIKNSNKCST
jgi:hypothetical protein